MECIKLVLQAGFIEDENQNMVCMGYEDGDKDYFKDWNKNARRICAAWTACEGLEVELLEGLPLNFKEHALQCAELREENARLLAAVQEMEKMMPVLEYLTISRLWETAKTGTDADLSNYRQTLEIALAKRSKP